MNDARLEFLSLVAMMNRRRWLALSIVWTLCLIGWCGSFLLPDQYKSTAQVYFDTDTLLGPLLKDLTVENDMQHKVPLIMRTLLSHPNLHKVAVATDLALATQSPADELNLYEHMERHADISALGNNLLSISYSDPNPVLARDVVQALLAVLVDNSTAQNRTEMDKALDFIEKQIAAYEEKLRGIESRIADFKREHGDVVVSSDSNLSARKDSLRDAVSAAQGQVAELKAGTDLLSQQIRTIPQFLSLDNAPSVIVTNGKTEADVTRVDELRRKLAQLKMIYTDKYPDVIVAKRQLQGAELSTETPVSGDDGTPRYRSQLSNPVYEQMQMRLFEAEQQLALSRNRLSVAQAAQAQLDRQAAEHPTMVAQFTDMSREYDVLKKQYDELLVRREAALMSQAVENTSQKIQYRVVDPPRIPVKPAGPFRLLRLPGVLAASIAAAIGVIFVIEHIEAPVSSPIMLARHSPLPLLGMITCVRSKDDDRRKRRLTLGFGLASLALMMIFCGLCLVTLQSSGLLAGSGAMIPDRMSPHVG